MTNAPFEIFLSVVPGLENVLLAEANALGFKEATQVPGGVTIQGGWPDVWRANLHLRGASRVLARIGAFRAFHLAQLDKRARKFAWGDVLRPDVPVKVEVTCKKSKIYHAGAATQRIERALFETLGVTILKDAPLRLMARIEDDLCTFSLDTSGAPLHRRGFKEFVGKAPMRETMAALILHKCGYSGTEPVLDPMCGSGTFVIEAAEIALNLPPGRARSFAFEMLKSFDSDAWSKLQTTVTQTNTSLKFFGSDRDAGAIRGANDNAARSGVHSHVVFTHQAVSNLNTPDLAGTPPGLVIINPPYGARVGNKKPLYGLHAAMGKTLLKRFKNWRIGLVTTDSSLANATGLPFDPPSAPIAHGGLNIKLWQTAPLK